MSGIRQSSVQAFLTGAMSEILQVRRGAADDFELILAMIDEAATWLRDKQTDQWAQPWPSRTSRDERVRRGLRDGGTWIVEENGAPIATITYRPTGNLRLWTRRERRQPSVYVSRLIVCRSHAGLGIGEAIVNWAGLRALRDWGGQWIRIDVWTTNAALHNYYEKRGFHFRRVAEVKEIPNRNGRHGGPDRWPSAALFQKPTDEVDATAAQRFEEVGPAVASQAAARAAGERPRPAGPSVETSKPSIESAKPGVQPASPGIQPPGKDARAVTTSVRAAANGGQALTADVESAASGSRSAVLSTTGGIGSSF
jgi:GNAT superfamily N-acetyltransferase